MMKKVFRTMSALCLALTLAVTLFSCAMFEDGGGDTGDGGRFPSDSQSSQDAVYSSLIGLLRSEIERLRSEQNADRDEYSERIAALESELAAVKEAAASASPKPSDSGTTRPAPDESCFTYTVDDGKATLTGYTGESESITVPETLGGYPVVALADDCFRAKNRITSVTLPEGLQKIGWFAFFGCTSLKSVKVPGSVVSIGYDAFTNCPKVVISCPSGSAAERYAKSYGISCSTVSG